MILNDLPWKQTEIILSFLKLHSSTAFWTLSLTMMAAPFLLRDSCPQYYSLLISSTSSAVLFEIPDYDIFDDYRAVDFKNVH